ncbi:MAG: methyltransferase domain-containing protein [Anaerolineae bacterium]|nr:methyltransferase domain-containing protein [Anaerolineae bacterium]
MSFFTNLQMMFSALTKPQQQVTLSKLPPGRVLDIGGGGEGVIAQVGGCQVVAVDKLVSEIGEARDKAPSANWLAADATRLPWSNGSFAQATAFFSCMYMSDEVKAAVFKETYRVLQPGGEFWIWDVLMSARSGVFALRLQATLPDLKNVSTAYGVRAKDQSAASLGSLLQQAGFKTEINAQHKHWFLLKACKTT